MVSVEHIAVGRRTYIVDQHKVCRSNGQRVPSRTPYVAVLDQSGRHGGTILAPPLNANENDDQSTEDGEEGDDPGIAPGVLRTTPLQSEQQADDRREEEERSQEIELAKLLLPALGSFDCLRGLEEE